MARAVYYTVGAFLVVPLVIVAAICQGAVLIGRLWQRIELDVVYKGDAEARDQAHWKDS